MSMRICVLFLTAIFALSDQCFLIYAEVTKSTSAILPIDVERSFLELQRLYQLLNEAKQAYTQATNPLSSLTSNKTHILDEKELQQLSIRIKTLEESILKQTNSFSSFEAKELILLKEHINLEIEILDQKMKQHALLLSNTQGLQAGSTTLYDSGKDLQRSTALIEIASNLSIAIEVAQKRGFQPIKKIIPSIHL